MNRGRWVTSHCLWAGVWVDAAWRAAVPAVRVADLGNGAAIEVYRAGTITARIAWSYVASAENMARDIVLTRYAP